ncbi:hypothetical protein C9374_010284 [Naegleria lovaniensis]|uniref:Uncharacterized protein n=1 Tax=Naegleria lovaniensis TaxID=51637 RepID=A0AA88GC81_NAELO|nr:uncharacterized protein C9374_010284 [Naegleria lovaniensis]KAG2374910.1 hypothetical protein C9374_010284 [Naegleria lovaniensis]
MIDWLRYHHELRSNKFISTRRHGEDLYEFLTQTNIEKRAVDLTQIPNQIDYISIVIIMGSVFVVLFLLILVTCVILRNSKRKYRFYQFQKREKTHRDFDKEFFKPSATRKSVSTSIQGYSIQSKEISMEWKPPVFALKPLPHFPHLFVANSSDPKYEGFVFYYKAHESLVSSISNDVAAMFNRTAGHQSLELAASERRMEYSKINATSSHFNEMSEDFKSAQSSLPGQTAAYMSQPVGVSLMSHSTSFASGATAVQTPPVTLPHTRSNLNSSTNSTSTVIHHHQPVMTSQPLPNIPSDSSKNIMSLHMDEMYRIIQRNYFSFREFVLYSPLLIERSITCRDPELFFPANLTLRQYITNIVLVKFKHMANNPELNDVWMEYIETFERCKYSENAGGVSKKKQPQVQTSGTGTPKPQGTAQSSTQKASSTSQQQPLQNSHSKGLTEEEFTIFLGHLWMLLNLKYYSSSNK